MLVAHRPTHFYLLSLILALFLVAPSLFSSSSSSSPASSAVQDPELVVQQVQESIRNASRRRVLGSTSGCQATGNPIDDCWRCDPEWSQHRQLLADCAIGFGSNAVGGRNGPIYVVTTNADDPVNPSPGMLRYGAIQVEPLWITFARDMVITLKEELLMNSYKTIDGRGASIHVAGGPCITIHQASNIIIHGINIHDCRPAGNAVVRDSPTHYWWRDVSDGDGVSIYGGKQVWVDHCTLSNCHDGLIDATRGSTAITISNNYMTHHNKVMLFGHSDAYTLDKQMQITVAFNHFGEGLIQRMPRCRHGYFHIVNNNYTGWGMYAIGGSAAPTINSQCNKFYAPNSRFHKEITKHEFASQSVWEKWSWRSQGDLMVNGAFFKGSEAGAPSVYARASSMGAKSPLLVDSMTNDAGTLRCRVDSHC